MYKIVVSYETGDSFGHEDVTEEIKCATLDIAKENLKRIKEHWDFYSWHEKERHPTRPEPALPIGTSVEKKYGSNIISLTLKTEKDDWTMSRPPWCGYFEWLHGASIEADHGIDSDCSFSVRNW